MASRVNVAVTGGGIVGLATGLKLLERAPELSVVVLEKEDRIAAHQTGHNSGVIHSGLYYKPGSEKAKTCVEGRRLLVEFCEKHSVPHEICGKLVVATSESELPALADLERRAGENGLDGRADARARGVPEDRAARRGHSRAARPGDGHRRLPRRVREVRGADRRRAAAACGRARA